MRIIIYERKCPKCIEGIMELKSNSIMVIAYSDRQEYKRFCCNLCSFVDSICE